MKKKKETIDFNFTDIETWLMVRHPDIMKQYEKEKAQYLIYE